MNRLSLLTGKYYDLVNKGMIAFNEGWSPPVGITEEMAKDLLKALVSSSHQASQTLNVPSASTVQSQHIAQYIEYMMMESGYTSLNITIDKDPWGTLVFTVNKKTK